MTKKNVPSVPQPKKVRRAPGKMIEHLKKVAGSPNPFTKGRNVTVLLLLLIAGALWMLIPIAFAGKIAWLYIFGNDGAFSGRQSGNVFMRNGRGRMFKVPALIQNSYTTYIRNLFSLQSQSWAGLSQAEQDSWNNAEGFFKSDRFGRRVAIRGKQLYISLNVNLILVGGTPITVAPLHTEQPAITSMAGSTATSAGVVSVIFAPTPTDGNVVHLLFATPSLSPGINRPKKSAFRLLGVIPSAQGSPFAAGTMYAAKYGNPISGAKVFLKTVPINFTSGEAGTQFVSEPIIVT